MGGIPSPYEIDIAIKNLHSDWAQMVKRKFIAPAIRSVVAESWEVCMGLGVSYNLQTAPTRWRSLELEQGISNNAQLLETARPIMNQLHKNTIGSGFLISLSDAEGTLLEVVGDPDVYERGVKNNFVPGADWSEAGVGTNGIGTCLRLRTPVQIFSAEHFCVGWQDWACAAAPIQDPFTGKILGVIDVSGSQELVHANNLGLVTSAAWVIQQQLKAWQYEIVQSLYRTVIDTSSDGLVVGDSSGNITLINSSALNMLNLSGPETIRTICQIPGVEEKFTQSQSGRLVKDERIKLSTGLNEVHVSCIPINYGYRFTGTLIVLRKQNALQCSSGFSDHPTTSPALNLPSKRKGFESIITGSPEMEKILRIAKIAATNEANVLLLGESGTGKELFARGIHEESSRADKPFVAVNCGAIPKELIASELFGYTEGSFTGALKKGKKGKFELASGGTLFLDEIGEMPSDMQVVLLRVLEERVVYPVGAEQGIPVNCRIIAATNQNLFKLSAEGKFRADLYYRLNVLNISIPPLRERARDVEIIADYLLKVQGLSFSDLDYDVRQLLLQYTWPGNIRELRNTIERLGYLSKGARITPDMLPFEIKISPVRKENVVTADLDDASGRETILLALQKSGNNHTSAAQMLKISRATLYRKLKKYNLK